MPEMVHKAPVKATAENGLLSRETTATNTDCLSKQQKACFPFRSEPLSFEPETKTPPLTMIYPILPPHPAWAPWEVIGRLQSNDISLLLGPALQL